MAQDLVLGLPSTPRLIASALRDQEIRNHICPLSRSLRLYHRPAEAVSGMTADQWEESLRSAEIERSIPQWCRHDPSR